MTGAALEAALALLVPRRLSMIFWTFAYTSSGDGEESTYVHQSHQRNEGRIVVPPPRGRASGSSPRPA